MQENRRLAAREWGEGQSYIVLLHGLYGHKEEWAKIAEALAPKYHLIAFDMRNHGESLRDSAMCYSCMAEDVARELQLRGIEKALIVGHSMSGRVAVRLAQNHAELVRGVVSLDSPPVGPFMAEDEGVSTLLCTEAMTACQNGKYTSPSELKAYLNGQVDAPLLVDYVCSHYDFTPGQEGWKLGLEGLQNFMRNRGVQEESPAGGVPCPYLLIKGAASPYTEHCTEEMVANWTSPSEVVVLPHTAHFVHFQARREVVAQIARFDEGEGR